MNEQIIVTPTGDRLVVIPESRYLAMVEALEDREDIAAVDAFQRRLAAGDEELIPAEIANRILNGENKIRVWREHRGLTARALAEKSGISAAYLSEIEAGKKTGGIGRLAAVAKALAIDLDSLV